jgi:hypothetical protein
MLAVAEFIGRQIEVMTEGEIKAPVAFRLGGREYRIAEILDVWQDYGFGLAEQGVVRNAMLCDLGHEGYSLRCPITVIIEEYDEETVARLPEVEAFASAATEPEALALLKEDIIRLYEDLISTPEEQLGTLPWQWRAALLRLIEKHGAP